MREIPISDAKARLAQLLDEVERGETLVITRHGRPVAHIVPAGEQEAKRRAIAEIRALRKNRSGPTTTIEEILAWRHEGHKY